MSALDDAVQQYRSSKKSLAKAGLEQLRSDADKLVELRREFAALRARVEQAERERDEARARVANQADSLDHWLDLWSHIVTRLGGFGTLPNEANFDALLDPKLSSTLTPRRCGTCCAEEAKAMREAAAEFADDFDVDSTEFDLPTSIGAGIRALPLPSCDGCNPLKTEDAS